MPRCCHLLHMRLRLCNINLSLVAKHYCGRLLTSQFHLYSVCAPYYGVEVFRNIFAPHCSLAIWLHCEETARK